MDVLDKAIDKESLRQLEYLFAQSVQGIHLLFDNTCIAKILSQPSEELDVFSFENLDRIQNIFSEFVNKQTLEEKRAYLDSLDEGTFELLVRTYFNIVENAVLESTDLKH
jgi:hypothetical protein